PDAKDIEPAVAVIVQEGDPRPRGLLQDVVGRAPAEDASPGDSPLRGDVLEVDWGAGGAGLRVFRAGAAGLPAASTNRERKQQQKEPDRPPQITARGRRARRSLGRAAAPSGGRGNAGERPPPAGEPGPDVRSAGRPPRAGAAGRRCPDPGKA